MKTTFGRIAGEPRVAEGTVYAVLFAISFTHLLNDMIQSVIPAIYPMIKDKYGFSFAQIGMITLAFQMTSSILQPFTGRYADRHPRPYALAVGMGFTLAGLLMLAWADGYAWIVVAVSVIGLGHRYSIRRRRGWRRWRPGERRAWRSPSSRWEATEGMPWDRCWRR